MLKQANYFSFCLSFHVVHEWYVSAKQYSVMYQAQEYSLEQIAKDY